MPNFWKDITGGRQSYSITGAAGLWAWGLNSSGQLGLGGYGKRILSKLARCLTGYPFLRDSSTPWLLKPTELLWAWGNGLFGRLGLGESGNPSSPVQVGAMSNWEFASAGYYSTLATKIDGTLWAWGRNNFGQLGLGNTTNHDSPVQVGALGNWSFISAGANHSLAISI